MVGLVLLRELPTARLTAVELQSRLAELARQNLVDNRLADRGEVVELDVVSPAAKRRLPGARFDWVVSNPPYQAIGRGAHNPETELAIARHELRLPLGRLCDETRRLLRPRGQAVFVYPAARLAELIAATSAVGLSPTRLRLCHADEKAPATRALLLCEKGAAAGRLVIEPPLYEHDAGGVPSAAARAIGGSEDASPPRRQDPPR